MHRQKVARTLNGFDQRRLKMFLLKLLAHSAHQIVPKFLAALLVNAFVADDSEFARSRHDEDEHGVALFRAMHSQAVKLVAREIERISLGFTALDVNPNLA